MARDPGKLFFRNVVARILSNIVVKVSFKLIQCTKNSILLPLLFLSTADREKLLKFKAEGGEFSKFLISLEQFIQTVKGQNKFW